MPRPSNEVHAVQGVVRLARALARASGELSLAHYRVLSAIAAGDDRASRIAGRLALGKPAVSSAVDALCCRGLLSRGPVAADQRAAALTLTEAGHAALEHAERHMLDRFDDVLRRTPDEQQVISALGWVADAMDAIAAERWAAR